MSRCGDCVYYMEWVASPSMSGMCKIFKMIVSRDRKACFWFRRGKKRKKRKCGECAYYKGFFMYPSLSFFSVTVSSYCSCALPSLFPPACHSIPSVPPEQSGGTRTGSGREEEPPSEEAAPAPSSSTSGYGRTPDRSGRLENTNMMVNI